MKPNPDNRRDNAEKIQYNIDTTIHNMELAEDMIARTSDEKARKNLEVKNRRREEALAAMRHEIKDETGFQESQR